MDTPLQRPKTLQTVGQALDEKSKLKKKAKSKPSDKESPPKLENLSIDSPSYVSNFSTLPFLIRPSQFEEGEERLYVDTESWQSANVQNLIQPLLNWMNDVLAPDRIVLTDLVEDLYDGLIIRKLLEHLANVDFGHSPMPLVSLNKSEQLKRLNQILSKCAEILTPAFLWDSARWTAEAMRNKNAIVIVQLSVALAAYFRAPIPIQQYYSIRPCHIRAVLVKRQQGRLYERGITEDLIPNLSGIMGAVNVPAPSSATQSEERDAFDTLFDHAPEKLNAITKSVLAFVNRYLNKLNIYVTDLTEQFRDGVYLILLIGSLDGYFIPFYQYHLTPKDYAQQLKNVAFAFRLMQDAGMATSKCRPEDIVNGDAKCILRTLFALYNRYQRV